MKKEILCENDKLRFRYTEIIKGYKKDFLVERHSQYIGCFRRKSKDEYHI